MVTSISCASGNTATVAVEVWMRPARLSYGNALHTVHSAFELKPTIGPLPFDEENDLLESTDAGRTG